MKKTASEQSCADETMNNTLTVHINGFAVVLDATKSPPTASKLFHAMFFVEELEQCPAHYRQQRWNARRIEKRWHWKKGNEREVYERRAIFLKQKWVELKEDLKINGKQCLSEQFRAQNRHLQYNDTDVEEEGSMDGNTNHNNNKENFVPRQQPQPQPQQQSEEKKLQILKKMATKRKQIRQQEKLVQRIADGAPIEEFVDFAKYAKIAQNTKKIGDDDLFGGVFATGHCKKQKHTKHKSKKQQKKAAIKLSEFVYEENQQLAPPAVDCMPHSHTQQNALASSRLGASSCSLDAIQAEQLADFVQTQRVKRQTIHTAVQETSTQLASTASPALSAVSLSSQSSSVSSTSTVPMMSSALPPPATNRELECVILNLSCAQFRRKCMQDIYCGSSVFSCVASCVDATDTLLIDAQFIENMLSAVGQTLSSLDGLLCFKKKLKKRFGHGDNKQHRRIEILPIFERAYVDKPCKQLLLVKFYDSHSDALTLYHVWKQHMHAIHQEHIKIAFVPSWFSSAFCLQHAHVWSDVACDAHIAVYDNNEKYISNIHHKYARHCHCTSTSAGGQPFIVYFPAFHPPLHHQQQPQQSRTHDVHCALDCCCCVYYNDANDDASYNDVAQNTIVPGDIVVWNAKRCTAVSEVNGFSQDYKIQINISDDANVVTAQYKYIVPLSSLQRLYENHNANAAECARAIDEHQFGALQQITADLSFVSYVKKFWNF